MPEDPLISFPSFVITLKDASGLMLLAGGNKVFLPIFTDLDTARTFAERTWMSPHPVLELPNAECLTIFLSNPPTRNPPFRADGIILDPLPRSDGHPVNVTVYSSAYFIELLKRMK